MIRNAPRFCDTTLRDGEQAPGVSFSKKEKIRIALLLDRLGVAEIEAGTPAAGAEEEEAVRDIAGLGLSAAVSAWCRARAGDVEQAARSGVHRVSVCIPASPLHLAARFARGIEWAEEALVGSVRRARELGLGVCAALEDAGRAPPENRERLLRAAAAAGADRVRISDTVGVLDPVRTRRLVEETLPASAGLPVEFHAHNDFGLATANALAAFEAGATHLSVTVLGIGERAGNAALEEVALALERIQGIDTGIEPRFLPDLFRAVSHASGRPVPAGKPIAGAAAFAHESGIHVHGLLRCPGSYEPFAPELVGRTRSVVIGKHSGRAALLQRLRSMGVSVPLAEVPHLLDSVKSRASATRRSLTDKEILCLLPPPFCHPRGSNHEHPDLQQETQGSL